MRTFALMLVGFAFGTMLGFMGYGMLTWQYYVMVGIWLLSVAIAKI